MLPKNEASTSQKEIPQIENQKETNADEEANKDLAGQEEQQLEATQQVEEIKEVVIKRLELENDYYCLTYVAHIKTNRELYKI